MERENDFCGSHHPVTIASRRIPGEHSPDATSLTALIVRFSGTATSPLRSVCACYGKNCAQTTLPPELVG
jgi:hypothetical protein